VVRAKTAEFEGWSARIRGEAERFRAITSMSNAVLDSFKARAEVVLKTAEQDISRWRVGIKQYEAQRTTRSQAQKINTDITRPTSSATLDAAKVGSRAPRATVPVCAAHRDPPWA
jgi:predicted secreted protein